MNVLGIETSCDETAAAVVRDGRAILANIISSQIDLHRPYGGVVPELAARSHLRLIDQVIGRALAEAQVDYRQLDAVAATAGPGLAAALLVGLNAAKGIAFALGVPFVAINHLEAHLYSPVLISRPGILPVPPPDSGTGILPVARHEPAPRRVVRGSPTPHSARPQVSCSGQPGRPSVPQVRGPRPAPNNGSPGGGGTDREDAVAPNDGTDQSAVFPLVGLIVSGGHTILAYATAIGHHEILGQTVDDAAGEAFDKVAKLLGLRYPGGPEIDRLARQGNPAAIAFPRSLLDEPTDNFSFSGLKTAVLYYLRKNPAARREDVCASFQEAVVDVLVGKLIRAATARRVGTVSAAGGVSINSRFRERLQGECQRLGLRLLLVPAALCADNAAMVAALACHKLPAGGPSDWAIDVGPSIGLGAA